MTKITSYSLLLLTVLLPACAGGASEVAEKRADPSATTALLVDSALGLMDELRYSVLSVRSLDADGNNKGLPAYDLIRQFGGPRPIESPDLYEINHPGVAHIFEDSDNEVGDHFVFVIHRDIDRDRGRLDITDRQRNEIKTYDRSEDAVKGYQDETLIYKWKFKINKDMEISKRFSHFFQLKAKGGNDRQPILTISGAERSGQDGIEIRHKPDGKGALLGRADWGEVTGEWLEAYCRITFAESAQLRLIVKRLSDGEIIFDVNENGLDFWRGNDKDHFVRPKWGIYRSLMDFDNLRAAEETVRFANFRVIKIMPDA